MVFFSYRAPSPSSRDRNCRVEICRNFKINIPDLIFSLLLKISDRGSQPRCKTDYFYNIFLLTLFSSLECKKSQIESGKWANCVVKLVKFSIQISLRGMIKKVHKYKKMLRRLNVLLSLFFRTFNYTRIKNRHIGALSFLLHKSRAVQVHIPSSNDSVICFNWDNAWISILSRKINSINYD